MRIRIIPECRFVQDRLKNVSNALLDHALLTFIGVNMVFCTHYVTSVCMSVSLSLCLSACFSVL